MPGDTGWQHNPRKRGDFARVSQAEWNGMGGMTSLFAVTAFKLLGIEIATL